MVKRIKFLLGLPVVIAINQVGDMRLQIELEQPRAASEIIVMGLR